MILFDDIFANMIFIPIIFSIISGIVFITIITVIIIVVVNASKEKVAINDNTESDNIIDNIMEFSDKFNNNICEYCGSKYSKEVHKCPNCGAQCKKNNKK